MPKAIKTVTVGQMLERHASMDERGRMRLLGSGRRDG